MSPLELVDDRFGELARELRASQPRVSAELQERIETLAPPPSRRMLPSLRRLAPAVALVALAGSLCVAAAIGLVHSGSREHQVGASETSTAARDTQAGMSRSFPVPAWKLQARSGALAPARDRLQQYDAALTLRVHDADELSTRTQQAMRLVRSLGGFVVSASFDVPGRRGVSTLVLRVPIGQVQAAIADLSGYGTLLAQKISIQDLQQRADRQAARDRCSQAGHLLHRGSPSRAPQCERAGQARAAARRGRAAARHDAEATRGHRAPRRPRSPQSHARDAEAESGRGIEPPRPDARRRGLGAGPRAADPALRAGRRRPAAPTGRTRPRRCADAAQPVGSAAPRAQLANDPEARLRHDEPHRVRPRHLRLRAGHQEVEAAHAVVPRAGGERERE